MKRRTKGELGRDRAEALRAGNRTRTVQVLMFGQVVKLSFGTWELSAQDWPPRVFRRYLVHVFSHSDFELDWFGIGQEAGICTRTVRFTGGDAAVTPQS